jgi:chaperone required for assembly of F1-ATPase
MSSDNGRPIYHHPPPSHKTSHRKSDERRYSPDALERQLNAELHLLDGVEASMQQVDNMERLRSVALAQQEVVSLAQVLKNVQYSINFLIE